MCGLAGFSLSGDESDNVDAPALAHTLLAAMEPRGQQATGSAWTAGSQVDYRKAPVSATEFLSQHPAVPPTATQAILHTRKATQGSPTEPRNNHPIHVGPIIGAHHGSIFNDEELFASLPLPSRAATVDSEAIFALLATGTGHPWGALEQLQGTAAVAWFDTTGPQQLHLARVNDNPLVIGASAGGSSVFATTHDAVHEAAHQSGMTLTEVSHIEEGTYLLLEWGGVVKRKIFSSGG